MHVNVPAPAFPFPNIHIRINKRKWGRVWRTLSALVIIGLVLLGAAVGSYITYRVTSGGDDDKGGTGETSNRYANSTTVKNDDDISDIKQLTDNAQQAAYKKIAETAAKLRSDLVAYDIAESGSTGDIIAKIYAPEKIYGFSAFPVQIQLDTRESPIPFNYVHIRKVTVYLKDEDGRVYWSRTWDYGMAGSEGLNGEEVVYTTILKVPDDYLSTVQQIISTGQVSREQVEQLFNASTKSWEIYVDIDAYRESWQSTNLTQAECTGTKLKWDSSTSTCYQFVKNIDIDYHVNTLSAWNHVTRAQDIVLIDDGMYSSIPVKFLGTDYASKWAIYQEKFAGAVSNVFTVTAAAPVHVMGSTADFKFNFAANPDYFSPLSPTISDDFRLVVVKVDTGGTYFMADSVQGNLGSLGSSIEKQLSARYTEDPDAVTYKIYAFAVFDIKRDDNTTIPVWLAVEPLISVLPNERLALDDEQIGQITQLVNDSEISEADKQQITAQVNDWINGLQDKIQEATELKTKAEAQNNQVAAEYAASAVEEYRAAINDLEKLKETADVQMFLNYLNAAKKHEMAGDYYKSAAYKALHGEIEQAELDAKKAQELSDLAKDYEPHFNFAELLGDNMLGVLLALIFAVILAGAVYLIVGSRKLAALVFIIVFVVILLTAGVFSFSSLKLPKLG